MRERRHRACFALEALARLWPVAERRRHDLDGDGPIEPRVPRAIDLPHPACPERADDLVRSQFRTGSKHQANLTRVEGPAPSGATISYGPRRVPGGNPMDRFDAHYRRAVRASSSSASATSVPWTKSIGRWAYFSRSAWSSLSDDVVGLTAVEG